MYRDCKLPPPYRLTALGPDADVADEALRLAAAGADPATILCAERDDWFDCAVILEPGMALARARLVLYVAALGLGDAIGAVVPAGIDLTYAWPNRIEANIGEVADIRLLLPESANPENVERMAVGVKVAVGARDGEGLHHGFPETSLIDEGCAEVTNSMLLEAFARHFLVWVNRWQDDGFDHVRKMWLRHSRAHEETVTIATGDGDLTGVFETIDDDGAMVLRQDGKLRHIELDAALAALAAPTW